MASVDYEMRQIDNLFKNKGIALSSNNIWLKSCVECFRTQCNSYSTKELLDFVFEQWLLADLREVRSFSLPKECQTLDKFTVTGKHAVQLNYTIDIGNSSYTQLQKIRKPNFGENLNIETERERGDQPQTERINGKRALKLEISDGQMTIIGFEYRPIPCLRNPVPGEKALLKGPIECRKGILMLTDKNIEIFGGEVDTLLIPNAVSNILARLLGQPEDPNPYKTQTEPSHSDNTYLSSCLEEDNDALVMLAEKIENSMTSSQQIRNTSNMNPASNSLPVNEERTEGLDFEDDDFDLLAVQTASLAEMQASNRAIQGPDPKLRGNKRAFTPERPNKDTNNLPQLTKATATVSSHTNSPDIVEYVDMNDPKRLKKELEQSYGTGNSYLPDHEGSSKTVTETGRSKIFSNKQDSVQTSSSLQASSYLEREERPSEYKLFDSSLSPSISSQETLEVLSQTKKKSLMPENNLINQEEKSAPWTSEEIEAIDSQFSDVEPTSDNTEIFYQPYPPRNFPAVRVIRGQVIRLSEKLSLKDDKWSLSAMVAANGLEIEMNFASEVLDKIFGVTATELIARKKDLKTNPAAKEQMNRLLKESQLRIKNLKCEMVIRFPSVMAKPIIIDVIQK